MQRTSKFLGYYFLFSHFAFLNPLLADSKLSVKGPFAQFTLELNNDQLEWVSPEQRHSFIVKDCNRQMFRDWVESFRPRRHPNSLNTQNLTAQEKNKTSDSRPMEEKGVEEKGLEENLTEIQLDGSSWVIDASDEKVIQFQSMSSRWTALAVRQELACQDISK